MTSRGLGATSPRLDSHVPATTPEREEGTNRLWWSAAAQGVDEIMHRKCLEYSHTGSTHILAASVLLILSCNRT